MFLRAGFSGVPPSKSSKGCVGCGMLFVHLAAMKEVVLGSIPHPSYPSKWWKETLTTSCMCMCFVRPCSPEHPVCQPCGSGWPSAMVRRRTLRNGGEKIARTFSNGDAVETAWRFIFTLYCFWLGECDQIFLLPRESWATCSCGSKKIVVCGNKNAFREK